MFRRSAGVEGEPRIRFDDSRGSMNILGLLACGSMALGGLFALSQLPKQVGKIKDVEKLEACVSRLVGHNVYSTDDDGLELSPGLTEEKRACENANGNIAQAKAYLKS